MSCAQSACRPRDRNYASFYTPATRLSIRVTAARPDAAARFREPLLKKSTHVYLVKKRMAFSPGNHDYLNRNEQGQARADDAAADVRQCGNG